MADQLAAPADLIAYLDEPDLGIGQATTLVEMATAIVQAAAGQRLVEVAGEQVTIMGTTESWLALPERPVSDVTAVEIDGEAVTDFKRFGARLWRASGWASSIYEPSEVAVTYSHGYAADDQRLEYARTMVLATAQQLFENPTGATSLGIDDYREGFSQAADASSAVTLPKAAVTELRRRYGVLGGLVRVG